MCTDNFTLGPSPYDPYSRAKLGWIDPIEVTDSLSDQPITGYMYQGQVYKLMYTPHEYFLVSNHNLNYPFDSQWEQDFPGQGLLIWHIDTTGNNVQHVDHKLVDVETADGLFDATSGKPNDSTGVDSIDVHNKNGYYWCFFNNTTKQNFNDTSNPSTDGYVYDPSLQEWKQTIPTGIAVNNIQGAGGDTMWADFYRKLWWGPDTVFLSSDFVVETGWKLHIVPGTVIKFATTDAHNVGNDASRCELIVHGTLEAWGSEGDSVCFRSASSNPSDSAWYGVEVASTGSLDLHYCKIQDALAGISWTSWGNYLANSANITHCKTGIGVDNWVSADIKYCVLDSNKTGVRVKTHGVANMDSCSILGGTVNICVDSLGSVNLNYCSMSESHSSVCLKSSGNATLNWTIITGPIGFGGGSDTGVVVNTGAVARLNNSIIRKAKYGMCLKSTTGHTKSVGCTFDSTETGIYFNNTAHDSVISCIFKNNILKGIWTLNNNLLDSNCTFVDSSQSLNGAAGVYCQANCSIKNSFFQGYQYGIKISDAKKASGFTPTIENCGFYDIGTIGIYSASCDPVIKKCCFKGSYNQYCIQINAGNPYIYQCYMASEDEGIPIGILFTDGATGMIRHTAIWDYNDNAVKIDSTSHPNFGNSDSVGCNWFQKPDSGEYYFYSQYTTDSIQARWNHWEEDTIANIQPHIFGKVAIGPVLGHCEACFPYYSDLCSDLPPQDPSLTACKIAVIDQDEKSQTYLVSQNYPNPFNPITIIKYNLPEYCHVMVEVYNVLGQKVKTLVDEDQIKGSQNVFWDGRDAKGREVSSGIYFYRIKAGAFEDSKRMILLR